MGVDYVIPQAPDLEDHRACERRWIDNQPGAGQHVRAALPHALLRSRPAGAPGPQRSGLRRGPLPPAGRGPPIRSPTGANGRGGRLVG